MHALSSDRLRGPESTSLRTPRANDIEASSMVLLVDPEVLAWSNKLNLQMILRVIVRQLML